MEHTSVIIPFGRTHRVQVMAQNQDEQKAQEVPLALEKATVALSHLQTSNGGFLK